MIVLASIAVVSIGFGLYASFLNRINRLDDERDLVAHCLDVPCAGEVGSGEVVVLRGGGAGE